MTEDMSCVVCGQAVVARENVLFEVDGRVVHVRCFLATRKPVTPPAPDLICRACSNPIRPAERVIRRGADVIHTRCVAEPRPPIAGGSVVPAWTLVGDQRIGRRFGLTRAGISSSWRCAPRR